MSDRSNYLMRLALTCQLADERAAVYPDDRLARSYAEAVRLLFLDGLALPEDHPQFAGGAEAASFALVACQSGGAGMNTGLVVPARQYSMPQADAQIDTSSQSITGFGIS